MKHYRLDWTADVILNQYHSYTITEAAHTARAHTVLKVFSYGGHVGGHFGEKSCTYYSFVTKVMCTKFGAERPTSHFSQGRPFGNGGHIGGHFGKKS